MGVAKRAYSVLSTLYGYIRTSRRLIAGEPGNDPDTQRLHLADAGVPAANLYQDLGVSGSTGTTTRQGWHSLNSHLHPGDVLVVASADRVGPPSTPEWACQQGAAPVRRFIHGMDVPG